MAKTLNSEGFSGMAGNYTTMSQTSGDYYVPDGPIGSWNRVESSTVSTGQIYVCPPSRTGAKIVVLRAFYGDNSSWANGRIGKSTVSEASGNGYCGVYEYTSNPNKRYFFQVLSNKRFIVDYMIVA